MAHAVALTSDQMIEELRVDVLWMLTQLAAVDDQYEFRAIQNMSRADLAYSSIVLHGAVRDIIVRLTAFDDEGRGNRSFQRVQALLNSENKLRDQLRAKAVSAAVTRYRKALGPLKNSLRNKVIAHVAERSDVTPGLGVPSEVRAAAAACVATLDAIAGKRVEYEFRVGSQELPTNLRTAIGVEGKS